MNVDPKLITEESNTLFQPVNSFTVKGKYLMLS
jgi:hypothetical protein